MGLRCVCYSSRRRAVTGHEGVCVCTSRHILPRENLRCGRVQSAKRSSRCMSLVSQSPCQHHAASLLGRKADRPCAPPTYMHGCMHAGLRTAFRRGQTSSTVISHSKPEEWSRRTHDRVNCAAAANAAPHQPTPYSPGWVLRTADIKNLRLVIWRLG